MSKPRVVERDGVKYLAGTTLKQQTEEAVKLSASLLENIDKADERAERALADIAKGRTR